VVLAGSSPQKAGFLVNNWSVILAEARADNDRSRVYLSQPRVLWARMWDLDNELETEFYYSLHSIVCFCFQGRSEVTFSRCPFLQSRFGQYDRHADRQCLAAPPATALTSVNFKGPKHLV
jgi:hypothetical protein